jgi:hypothetical protein
MTRPDEREASVRMTTLLVCALHGRIKNKKSSQLWSLRTTAGKARQPGACQRLASGARRFLGSTLNSSMKRWRIRHAQWANSGPSF